jgi:prolyl-tRNA synthetase
MRGVPLRIEFGPKDIAKQSCVLARRDRPGKEGKSFVPLADLPQTVMRLLDDVQKSLHDRALAFREAHTRECRTYAELQKAVETGFAYTYWCGGSECEAKIKEETKATARCIPLQQPSGSGICVLCGKAAHERTIFARAY